jgi:hypothetical protein
VKALTNGADGASPATMLRTARFSDDEQYRYSLGRLWNIPAEGKPRGVCWVMLNPSTADHEKEDPTITRCITRSRELGYDGLVICNLFALRSTDPKYLIGHPDPVGPDNERTIEYWTDKCGLVVAAWGQSFPKSHDVYVYRKLKALRAAGAMCLGKTKSGQPRHPLYVATSVPVEAL